MIEIQGLDFIFSTQIQMGKPKSGIGFFRGTALSGISIFAQSGLRQWQIMLSFWLILDVITVGFHIEIPKKSRLKKLTIARRNVGHRIPFALRELKL